MIYYAPDPFSGRCQNYRADPYGASSRRCLDYEGTQHVCTFDPPSPPPLTNGYVHSLTVPRTPEPWQKPARLLDAPDNQEKQQ